MAVLLGMHSYLFIHSLATCYNTTINNNDSLCGEGEMLYLVTKNNCIVVMQWTGDIAEQFSLSDVIFLDSSSTINSALSDMPLTNGDDQNLGHTVDGSLSKLPQLPPESIIQFTYAPAIHTFCLVLSNGSVVIMQAKPTMAPLATRLRAYFLSFPTQSSGNGGKAVCASLNASHRLAAIGCDGGDVRLYKIPQLFLHASISSSNLLPKSQPQQKLQSSQHERSEQTHAQRIEHKSHQRSVLVEYLHYSTGESKGMIQALSPLLLGLGMVALR